MNSVSTPPTGYSYRPLETNDVEAIIALTASIAEADRTEGAATREKLTHIFQILGESLQTNTLAAVSRGGTLAAMAFVIMRQEEDHLLAMIDGNVHVDHRGRGLGSYMLTSMELRAKQECDRMGGGGPLVIRTSCADHLSDRIALFESSGFEAVRYSYQMQRDLKQLIPEARLPGNIHLVGWSQELDKPLRLAFNKAFKGSWGVPEMDEQLWRQFFTGVPQFRSDLTFLAMDDTQIAGFCVNWVDESKNRQRGVQEGWVEALGVLPEWRGQGLASALLVQSMNGFLADGMTLAALDVDTQNPTGALRLYEKLGFVAIKRSITFRKVVN